MSFIPFINTPYGPKVLFPIHQLVQRAPIKGNVSNTQELESKLLEYVNKQVQALERKISAIPSSATINVAEVTRSIKALLKADIEEYIASKCVAKGDYSTDKQNLEHRLEVTFNKFQGSIGRILETQTVTDSKLAELIAHKAEILARIANIRSVGSIGAIGPPGADAVGQIALKAIEEINKTVSQLSLKTDTNQKLFAALSIKLNKVETNMETTIKKRLDELQAQFDNIKDHPTIMQVFDHIGDITAQIADLRTSTDERFNETDNMLAQHKNMLETIESTIPFLSDGVLSNDARLGEMSTVIDGTLEAIQIQEEMRTKTEQQMNILEQQFIEMNVSQNDMKRVLDRIKSSTDNIEQLQVMKATIKKLTERMIKSNAIINENNTAYDTHILRLTSMIQTHASTVIAIQAQIKDLGESARRQIDTIRGNINIEQVRQYIDEKMTAQISEIQQQRMSDIEIVNNTMIQLSTDIDVKAQNALKEIFQAVNERIDELFAQYGRSDKDMLQIKKSNARVLQLAKSRSPTQVMLSPELQNLLKSLGKKSSDSTAPAPRWVVSPPESILSGPRAILPPTLPSLLSAQSLALAKLSPPLPRIPRPPQSIPRSLTMLPMPSMNTPLQLPSSVQPVATHPSDDSIRLRNIQLQRQEELDSVRTRFYDNITALCAQEQGTCNTVNREIDLYHNGKELKNCRGVDVCKRDSKNKCVVDRTKVLYDPETQAWGLAANEDKCIDPVNAADHTKQQFDQDRQLKNKLAKEKREADQRKVDEDRRIAELNKRREQGKAGELAANKKKLEKQLYALQKDAENSTNEIKAKYAKLRKEQVDKFSIDTQVYEGKCDELNKLLANAHALPNSNTKAQQILHAQQKHNECRDEQTELFATRTRSLGQLNEQERDELKRASDMYIGLVEELRRQMRGGSITTVTSDAMRTANRAILSATSEDSNDIFVNAMRKIDSIFGLNEY